MSTPAPVRQPRSAATLLGCGLIIAFAAGCHTRRPSVDLTPDLEAIEIGYGSRDRRDVTGAVSSSTSGNLAGPRSGRVEDTLEGRFPGLDVVRLPGGDYRLRIRGGNADPLIVIDGIPSPLGLPNPLQDLVPTQIRAVTVLKDAGSTSAFGARGANGVILITTRRGN